MTTTDTTAEVNDPIRNGVDTATLFATLDAVKQAPEAASFQFRAHNQWVSGTHNRGTIADYFGVGEERTHEQTFVFDADHPAVLVGQDHGPTPVEFVLHALAACLTAGLANIAAARKVRLTEVRSTVSGDIDLNGILGLNPAVRNGYQQITVRFTIKGDAPAEKLRELWTSPEPARRSMTSSPTGCPSPSRWTPRPHTSPGQGTGEHRTLAYPRAAHPDGEGRPSPPQVGAPAVLAAAPGSA